MEKENGKESKRERKRKREREREMESRLWVQGVGGRNNYLFVLCTGKGEAVWQVMWALLWMWV